MASIKADPDSRASTQGLVDHHMSEAKPSYKSWKKKYRKMRLEFDQRMQESEDLHKLEQKATRLAKRLAIENDRLMDLLLDINSRPQLPVEKRIDIDRKADTHDSGTATSSSQPKSLASLINTVPHKSYDDLVDHLPEIKGDLDSADPDGQPVSFLNANDVDDYIYELDTKLERDPRPTLAPSARPGRKPDPSINFALRNPTSVYNWLRKHAPKTFLQDLEKDKDKEKRGGDHDSGDRDAGNKRKSAVSRSKKPSGVARKGKDKGGNPSDTLEWDDEAPHDVQSAKGKRKRGEDSGYRPKGGSSRPSKKRKSAGGEPKSRKSLGD